MKHDRSKQNQRMICCLVSACVLLLLLFAASVRWGSVQLSFDDIAAALGGRDAGSSTAVILFSIRIPRAVACVIAGVGLSLSGALLQAVTDNALAGPNIIGVNAGAGFACVCVLAFFPSLAATLWGLPLSAFCGAFAATALILLLARGQNSRAGIILAGAALTALLGAGISVLTLWDTDLLSAYNAFSVGGFSGVSGTALYCPAILVTACLVYAVLYAPRTAVLCLGDTAAAVLGIRVRPLRLALILCASLSAGAVVSFAGLLGFVGLLVPHMARRLADQSAGRAWTVFCAVLGACVTLAADLAGRVLLAPTELPVGIMMALIGGPFFLYLIWRQG